MPPPPPPQFATADSLPRFAPVYFATGSARLSPNGTSLVDEIARAVDRQGVVLLEVRGFADTRGSLGRNLQLARNTRLKRQKLAAEVFGKSMQNILRKS